MPPYADSGPRTFTCHPFLASPEQLQEILLQVAHPQTSARHLQAEVPLMQIAHLQPQAEAPPMQMAHLQPQAPPEMAHLQPQAEARVARPEVALQPPEIPVRVLEGKTGPVSRA